mmetsp:Transcript_112194/g.239609  ORF Transcript_112194/g.239609 Transcript_112194/m.239609 type:complete len:260 (-) Transcript_112194:1338-2117(-)
MMPLGHYVNADAHKEDALKGDCKDPPRHEDAVLAVFATARVGVDAGARRLGQLTARLWLQWRRTAGGSEARRRVVSERLRWQPCWRWGRGDVRPPLARPLRMGQTWPCGATSVVDHVLHLAMAGEIDRQRRLHKVCQPRGDRDSPLHRHSIVPEEVVDPQAVRTMRGHTLVHAVAHIAGMPKGRRYVVGQLGLEEVGLAALTGPLHLVLQGVLHGKPVHGHVVASDDQACLARIGAALHQPRHAMIRTPEPHIVAHDVS